MKLFTVVDDAYDDEELVNGDIMKKDKITLQCNALIKFLPYKGFYPAERIVELARLLSASCGPFMECKSGLAETEGSTQDAYMYTTAGNWKNTSYAFRAFTEPLIGPGILCNTIKSGIACGNWIVRNYLDVYHRGTTGEQQDLQ